MPNFRSLGQSLHVDNFCKIDGGGGGPLLSFWSNLPIRVIKFKIAESPAYFLEISVVLVSRDGNLSVVINVKS